MTVLTTFASLFPPDPSSSGDRLAVALLIAEARAEHERREIDAAWTERHAELDAHAATIALLGAEAAELAVWTGRRDGTASGVLDGLAVTWRPGPGSGRLSVHRACPSCERTATVAVTGAAQLAARLARPSCACPTAHHRAA